MTLVGDEVHLPYERPGLSKGYLLGATKAGELDVLDPGFYADQDITLALGARAADLALDARRVRTASGAAFAFSRMLIATGARSNRLAVPGAVLVGVHYLRDREDSDRLGAALRAANDVVVIGAGWLGSELAAASHTLGQPHHRAQQRTPRALAAPRPESGEDSFGDMRTAGSAPAHQGELEIERRPR
ncbi:FAD-dependent oxidoreductase [Actinomadura sp. NPDC049753]|uniref:FAD-dependent oxidoreductase n=1 Tax=Actinomadura sp. NPDC049753 TaxID=3154739 RepID=UPI003438C709